MRKWFITVLAVLVPILVIGGLRAANPATPTAISTVLVSDGNGHGSGVHIGQGYILTAAHVVKGHDSMEIKDSAGNTQKGVVLWLNEVYDVALIHIDNSDGIHASPLICTPTFAVGDDVQAVGNPLNLEFIHTWGRVASNVGERGPWKSSLIVDMTIAPGMSGGPVLNKAGEVIGLAVGIAVLPSGFSQSALAISYVVPSSAVCNLLAR